MVLSGSDAANGRARQRFWSVEQTVDGPLVSAEAAVVAPTPPQEPSRGPVYAWTQEDQDAPAPGCGPMYPPKPPGVIEIVLWDGVCVRVDNSVDTVALRRVLTALQSR